MGRKNKQNDFEVIIPSDSDAEIKRAKILDANNVLNRLNNLERDYNIAYNSLVLWVYNEFKSSVPCSDPEHVDDIPLMSVLKRLPLDKFNIFLDMLWRCEDTVEFNKNLKTLAEIKVEREKEEPTAPVPEYISFTIARYALTDVIEELHNSNVKDIIVTKENDNLVVKYKPSWRK